jgi:hypothetical protein
MKTAKIVSTGPLGTGTKVIVDGVELPSVISIKIGEIKADELLTATVTLAAEVDMTEVELLVDEDTLRRSAEAQGLELCKSFPLIMEPMEFVDIPIIPDMEEVPALVDDDEEESPLTAALRFMADYVEEQEAPQRTDLAALVARAEKERPHDTLVNDLIAGMRELAERHNRLADQLESPLKKRMQERLRERAVTAEAEVARLTAERGAAKDWPKEEVAPGQWVDVDPESLARATSIPATDTLRQASLGPIEADFNRRFNRRIDVGGKYICTGGKTRCEDCRCNLPSDWKKQDVLALLTKE